MNNIPIFLSQGGTASLILREIPYSKKAYVSLETVVENNLGKMIDECAAFCRACGAEEIFVTRRDSAAPLPRPHAHHILSMTIQKDALPESIPVKLVPIQEDNDSIYLRIYNQCFSTVSGAAFYDRRQLQRIYLLRQQAFLALTEDGTPFGMGELHENELAAIGVLPEFRGRGYDLALSLLTRCPGPELTVTVASDNPAALRLYEKIGFMEGSILSSWYLA